MKRELGGLKKGDKVIVGGAYINDRISQVEKVTKKHIIVEGLKYNRTYGWVAGLSSSSSNHIKPATEEDIRRVEEETEKRNILNYLTKIHFKELSYEALVAIRDIVEKEIGKLTTKEIVMWLARDKEGYLRLYRGEKPERFYETWSTSSFDVSPLQRNWFPEVQWSDDEPTKVKLIIEK